MFLARRPHFDLVSWTVEFYTRLHCFYHRSYSARYYKPDRTHITRGPYKTGSRNSSTFNTRASAQYPKIRRWSSSVKMNATLRTLNSMVFRLATFSNYLIQKFNQINNNRLCATSDLRRKPTKVKYYGLHITLVTQSVIRRSFSYENTVV